MKDYKYVPSTNEIEMYKFNFDTIQSDRELRLECIKLAQSKSLDLQVVLDTAKEYYKFAITVDKPNANN